ncbi:hypothetical protein A5700_12240 [Mycobacterium sp. E1214]|nr:hypothetical protein A5700_12240 [Mycobacterium sp. E1214]OBH28702.1 hypothetical protein A5693_21555 [Mycobacterium sp. E1319]
MTKDATAQVIPAEDEAPNGSFDVILSTDALDRDGDRLHADEWKTPLPEHITFDSDHGMSVATTVGSGKPFINEKGQLQVRGTFASTPHAQTVRTLVNEGHIKTVSVAFSEQRHRKDAKPVRELLNAAFVAVPANPEAVVLSSKSDKKPYGDVPYADPGYQQDGKARYPIDTADHVRSAWSYVNQQRNASQYTAEQLSTIKQRIRSAARRFGIEIAGDDKAFTIGAYLKWVTEQKAADGISDAQGGDRANPTMQELIQAIHDAAYHLGAMCSTGEITDFDTGASSGANKSASGVVTKDARKVLAGLDATLDEATKLSASVDRSTLPGPVGQALDLLVAAQESAGRLMALMGVYDPDNPTNASGDSAGSPQGSTDDSTAATAAKAAAAADDSAERAALRARSLAFLIKANTKD